MKFCPAPQLRAIGWIVSEIVPDKSGLGARFTARVKTFCCTCLEVVWYESASYLSRLTNPIPREQNNASFSQTSLFYF